MGSDGNKTIGLAGINVIDNHIPDGCSAFFNPHGGISFQFPGGEQSGGGTGKNDFFTLEHQLFRAADGGSVSRSIGEFFEVSSYSRPRCTPVAGVKQALNAIV